MEIDNCFQVHGNAWVQQNSCWDGWYSCAEEFELRILFSYRSCAMKVTVIADLSFHGHRLTTSDNEEYF